MSRPVRSIDARSPAARASQRLSWRYACGERPAGRASRAIAHSSRGRPRCWRVTRRSSEARVGEPLELDPHGVGMALHARRELLGGRRAPQLAERAEQPRAKRIGEGVVIGRRRELPCAPLPFSLSTVKNSPCGSHATRGVHGADVREATPAGLEGLGAGGPAGGPVRLLRARAPGLPDLHGQAADAAARRRPSGQVLYTGADIHKGQQVFLHNGLMEYGSVFGHGAYLGPDFTADYLRRASDFVIGRYGGAGSDSAARRTIARVPHQPLRQADRHAHAHRRAGRGLPAAGRPLLALLLRPDDGARAAAERDHRPHRAAAADRVLRLDGVGGFDPAARATTTPTPTTGRPSRASTTSRPRT